MGGCTLKVSFILRHQRGPQTQQLANQGGGKTEGRRSEKRCALGTGVYEQMSNAKGSRKREADGVEVGGSREEEEKEEEGRKVGKKVMDDDGNA